LLAAAEMRATVKYGQIRFTSASGQGYAPWRPDQIVGAVMGLKTTLPRWTQSA
jgi:hypothetical protein